MAKARLTMDHTLTWYCPGCECNHGVPIQGKQAWGWNGSFDKPTLTPSVLVHEHETMPPFKPQYRCHCFVVDGKVMFLTDSGHKLAGQTIEMEDEE